jgi:hypothetical protein
MLPIEATTMFCKGTAEQDAAFACWSLDRNFVVTALMVGEASLLHHKALTKKGMFDLALAAVGTFCQYNNIRHERSL